MIQQLAPGSRRVNSHGQVRCAACKRWLDPSAFGHPPSYRGRPESYCRTCRREIDRMRWRGERRERSNAQRQARMRAEREEGRRDRVQIVQQGIVVLGKRGFTQTEIAKLTGTTFPAVQRWARGLVVPTTGVVRRFVVVLRATAEMPMGETVAKQRRLPHPELELVLAAVGPRLARIPVRGRSWETR